MSHQPSYRARNGVLALAVLLAATGLAPAQPPRPALQSLNDVIGELSWNPAARGPLIIVAPEKALPERDQEGKLPAPPEQGPDGYRIQDLATYFGFRLVPCGGVSVFAPATTQVLATRFPRPDVYAGFSASQLLTLLAASLTERQWQQLGSELGMGLADLSGKQRDIFNALIPDPLRIVRSTLDGERQMHTETLTLTAAQRNAARVRLRKRVTFAFLYGKESTRWTRLERDEEEDFPKLTVTNEERRTRLFPGHTTQFGFRLVQTVPARLKPGDLPFDWSGLNPLISLTGAETVGELVARVRAATGVDLYADPRLSALRVAARGSSVRSGDVLTALCYGVTGAFRKVGRAFVLTDDRTGYGVRFAHIDEWVRGGEQEAATLRETLNAGVGKRAAANVPWETSDGFSDDANLTRRVAEFNRRAAELPPEEREKAFNLWPTIPLAELPTAARNRAQKQADYLAASHRESRPDQPVRTDVVLLQTEEDCSLVLPGVGVARMTEIGRGSAEYVRYADQPAAPPEDTPIPFPASDRALLVAPADARDAASWVRQAARQGYSRVWVAVVPGAVPVVEAAVKAGKEAKIPVGAVVRVLRAGDGDTLQRDLNLFGEDSLAYARRATAAPEILRAGTPMGMNAMPQPLAAFARLRMERETRWGPWLRTDATTRATVTSRLLAIARVPGLAGLVLRDLHAPGYYTGVNQIGLERPAPLLSALGYAEEMRAEFLIRHGVDPVDLGTGPDLFTENGSRATLLLPFFPDYGVTGRYASGIGNITGVHTYKLGAKDAAEKWQEFRAEIGREFAGAVYSAVRDAVPQLPVWVHRGQEDSPHDGIQWLALPADGPDGSRYAAPPVDRPAKWPPPPPPGSAPNRPPGPPGDFVMPPPPPNPFLVASGGARRVSRVFNIRQTLGDLPDTTRKPRLRSGLMKWSERLTEGWKSVTFDLSDLTPDAARAVLDAIHAELPKP
jgi:hypothetical protein